MSKVKNSKRKGTAPDSKLVGVKIEPDLRNTLDNETSVTNLCSHSDFSASKSFPSKCEVSSCYDTASSCVLTRDSSTDNVSNYMKNAMLEEVLSEKKAALLQSPEITKLLRDEQLKQQQKK